MCDEAPTAECDSGVVVCFTFVFNPRLNDTRTHEESREGDCQKGLKNPTSHEMSSIDVGALVCNHGGQFVASEIERTGKQDQWTSWRARHERTMDAEAVDCEDTTRIHYSVNRGSNRPRRGSIDRRQKTSQNAILRTETKKDV